MTGSQSVCLFVAITFRKWILQSRTVVRIKGKHTLKRGKFGFAEVVKIISAMCQIHLCSFNSCFYIFEAFGSSFGLKAHCGSISHQAMAYEIVESDDDGVDVKREEAGTWKSIGHTDQASSAPSPSWLLAKPVLPPTDCDSQQKESQAFESESEVKDPETANADPYQELNKYDDCTFAAKVAAAKNAAHERAKKAAQDAEAKQVAEEAKAKKAAQDAEAMRVAKEAKEKKAAEDADAARVAEEAKTKKAEQAEGGDEDDDGAKQRLKRKAMEMINDPKFKKGTKLLDLSPDSQKVMKEIRKIRAIENSNRWHDTWDSKGKPREREQPESSGPASGHSDGIGGQEQEHKDAGADVEEQEHGGSDGNAGAQGGEQGEPRTLTLKDARVTCQLCSYCVFFHIASCSR